MWSLGVAALCCLRSTRFIASPNKVIPALGRKHWAKKCLFGKSTIQTCFSRCSIIPTSQLHQQQQWGQLRSARYPDIERKQTAGEEVCNLSGWVNRNVVGRGLGKSMVTDIRECQQLSPLCGYTCIIFIDCGVQSWVSFLTIFRARALHVSLRFPPNLFREQMDMLLESQECREKNGLPLF